MKTTIEFLSHLFIPRESNNYRSKVLHHDFLSVYLLFAIMSVLFIKSIIQSPLGNVLGFATDISIQKLYSLTNMEREKNNLPALSYNENLSKAAYKKAQDMFTKNYWAHYAKDGTTPWNFILQEGYQYEYAGENLAKNFLFSDGVVKAWMDSKTHKENILRSEYSDMGFAVANGVLNGEETTLVVQMFGKPLKKQQSHGENPPLETTVKIPSLKTESTPAILGENKFSFWNMSLRANLIFFSLLLAILFADFYVARKLKIIRVTGKNIAHMFFIAFIIFGILLSAKGAII